jgi:hypothetical protein
LRETLGYNKNHKDRQKHDFYATPPEEVKNILQFEKLNGIILENSCGAGHMVEPIKEKYPNSKIIATDKYNYGYGETGLDFLSNNYPYIDNINCIIMNPPFKLIEEFVTKSLKIAKDKIIVFARMQFAETEKRYENIFENNPPTTIYLYVDRVACAINGEFDKAQSSSMAFAWFVWDKNDINYGKHTEFKWIRRWDKQ